MICQKSKINGFKKYWLGFFIITMSMYSQAGLMIETNLVCDLIFEKKHRDDITSKKISVSAELTELDNKFLFHADGGLFYIGINSNNRKNLIQKITSKKIEVSYQVEEALINFSLDRMNGELKYKANYPAYKAVQTATGFCERSTLKF